MKRKLGMRGTTTPVRHTIGVLAVLALLGSVGAGVAQAAPSARPTDGMQGLAKGKLLEADGRPAAEATVTIYAVPNETADDPMVEGESRTFEVIGSFKTDNQGRYAAAVKRSDLARHRDRGGNVNAELIARDARGNMATMSIGLSPIDGSTGAVAVAPRPAADAPLTPVQVADLTLGDPATSVAKNSSVGTKGDARTTDSVQTKQWVKPIASTDAFVGGAGVSTISQAPTIACGSTLVTNMGNRTTWVGGTYVTTSGVVADLIHLAGSSSTLGVGVSASGSYGSFSASGTNSRSTDSETTFPAHSTLQHAYTGFVWGKYGYWCDNRPGYYEYKALSRYHGGGASTWNPGSAPSTPSGYCASYVSGSSFTKTTTTAYSFSTGADTSGSIGIDLSSRTGYSTTLKASYKFSATRKLCGTNGLPANTPGRLVARS